MKSVNIFITAMVIFISGCANRIPLPPAVVSTPTSSEQEILIQAVRNSLKDPDSAKFGDAVIINYGKGACVKVNAKNTYGGYTGYQEAMLANVQGLLGWTVIKIQGISRNKCISALNRVTSQYN